MKFKVLSISLIIVIQAGCQFQKPVNSYPFYETTTDNLPSLEEVRGILITACNHPSEPCYALIIGDRKEIEQIIGFNIMGKGSWDEPVPIENNPTWTERLYTHYVNSKRIKRNCDEDTRMVFITDERAYMVKICYSNFLDENYIYGDDYCSGALKKDFEELGLFD